MGKYLDLAEKARETAVCGHLEASSPRKAEDRHFQETECEISEISEISPPGESKTECEISEISPPPTPCTTAPPESLPLRRHRFRWTIDPDDTAIEEGRRIVEAVRARGVWMNFKGGEIGIQWWGDISNTGAMLDEIRAELPGVAAALAAHNEDDENAKYDRLEREAIVNESDFNNAIPLGDDSGMIGDQDQ